MKEQKVIYYNDELNDEFSEAKIETREINEKYKYKAGIIRKILRVVVYGGIMHPIAFFHTKVILGNKIIGAKVLRKYKGACYIYGNHTHPIGDAYIPSMARFPRGTYLIVHPNNVSMPFLGRLTPCMGAIPLPTDMRASRNYAKDLDFHAKKNHSIMVYPEAHIWPYYTKIRPFTDKSFSYPVKYNVPAFCITNTYQKRKFSKKPRIVSYVDGPFYPEKEGTIAVRRKLLRDQVYNKMCERAENNNVIYVKYIKNDEKI